MGAWPEPGSTLNDAALEFLTERHLATLATTRPTGTPHVVAVGFTHDRDTRIARVITVDGSQKVRNVERGGYAAVTHVDGPRWLTLEGSAVVSRNGCGRRRRGPVRPPLPAAKGESRRVVIEITVTRAMGSASLFG